MYGSIYHRNLKKSVVPCDDKDNKMASNKCDIQEDEFLSIEVEK